MKNCLFYTHAYSNMGNKCAMAESRTKEIQQLVENSELHIKQYDVDKMEFFGRTRVYSVTYNIFLVSPISTARPVCTGFSFSVHEQTYSGMTMALSNW